MSELLTFEWRRAKSIRTTWITSLFTVLGVAFFAFIAAVAITDENGNPIGLPVTDALQNSVITNPFFIVLISSLGAMAFGHEYRYGTIRLTLTAFTRRTGVFFAKLVMTIAILFIVTALSVAAGYAVIAASGKGETGDLTWTALAWHCAVAALTYGGLAFTLTVITRSHPLGIVGPLLIFMLEFILLPIIGGRYEWLPGLFPITAMTNWFDAADKATQGLGVWVAWMLGLLLVSFVLLKRRDA